MAETKSTANVKPSTSVQVQTLSFLQEAKVIATKVAANNVIFFIF